MSIGTTNTQGLVSPTKDTSLSRTLSWRNRPTSRGFEGTRVNVPSESTESTQEQSTDEASDAIASRNSIAQSLSSKDPTWFRQTSDRGMGSPALRKTQASDGNIGGSPKLPGLSREGSTAESEKPEASGRSRSPSGARSRTGSTYGTSSFTNRYSGVASASAGGLGSPVPLASARKIESRGSVDVSSPNVAMSPSQGRLAGDRPPSPTKGLGGFVQSAMLKRSDSVSKRWSVQSGSGNLRGPATPGPRNDGATFKSSPRLPGKPMDDLPRDFPRESNSRPGSSHSEAIARRSTETDATEQVEPAVDKKDSNDGFVKPAFPSRPSSRAGSFTSGGKSPDLPVTPSRTMDPRRWSPTKASWLESALNKPDSPKLRPQTEALPEWKKDVNRIKQARAPLQSPKPGQTGDATRLAETKNFESPGSPNKSEVNATEQKPSDLEQAEEVEKPETAQGRPEVHSRPSSQSALSVKTSKSPPAAVSTAEDGMSPITSVDTARATSMDRRSVVDTVSSKPKPPSPPIKDLRSNLRRRETTSDSKPDGNLEFRNLLGKLKKTETKNYVAPDKLKSNILRGKAALNASGGPQKSERVDEFKESLQNQKKTIKLSGGSIRRNTIDEKKPPPAVPEAIARRNRMNSVASNFSANEFPLKRTSTLDTPKTPSLPKLPSTAEATPVDTGDEAHESKSIEDRVPGRSSQVVAKPDNKPRADESRSSISSISPTMGSPLSGRASKWSPPVEDTPGIKPRADESRSSVSSISPALGYSLPGRASKRSPPVEDRSPDRTSQVVDPDNKPRADKSRSSVSSINLTLGSPLPGRASKWSPPVEDRAPGRTSQVAEPDNKPCADESRSSISSINSTTGAPVSSRASKGGLANRLNPGLVGLLSRGAPAQQTSKPNDTPTKSSSVSESPTELTHATKSRARGPKRRLPQGKKSDKTASAHGRVAAQKTPPKLSLSERSLPNPEDSPFLPDSASPKTARSTASSGILEAIRRRTPAEPPTNHDDYFQTSTSGDGETLPATRYTAPAEPASISTPPASQSSPITSPKSIDKPTPPPKPSTSTYSPIDNHGPSKGWPLPYSAKPVLSRFEPTHQRDGSNGMTEPKSEQVASKRPSPPPKKPSFSPSNRSESPLVPPKPRSLSGNKSIETVKSSRQSSPFPLSSEASRIFLGFFDAPPKVTDKVDVDPQSILLSKSESFPKISTLKKQIWEITGDGRKMDLPPDQEYILFEESMYLCVHVFEVTNGTKTTQVHLWCGDGVSEASLEDAQLFARKVARENSSKLEILKQGKETSGFIQALGGIIITRRGSSGRANSSYMLCGRRHLGQISFDEVDLDPRCLCSGYPYIISSNFGKLYLWQGKGSAADELGCARLIGMGLGSMGDVEEVTEGEEPASFFDAFPDAKGPAAYQSADYWRLKPNNKKYCNRLYRFDHSQGQRFGAGFWNRRGASSPTRPNAAVQEIEPFCQRDLETGHIYVLDAFFEIYV